MVAPHHGRGCYCMRFGGQNNPPILSMPEEPGGSQGNFIAEQENRE